MYTCTCCIPATNCTAPEAMGKELTYPLCLPHQGDASSNCLRNIFVGEINNKYVNVNNTSKYILSSCYIIHSVNRILQETGPVDQSKI